MNFRIQCVPLATQDKNPQLFAKVELPDFLVADGRTIETNNEGIPEEIIKLLNDAGFRDCIFSIAPKGNHSAAMTEYWKRRKSQEMKDGGRET